jgi:hypothetical protein
VGLDVGGVEGGDFFSQIVEQFEHGERRTSKVSPGPAPVSTGWG